MHIIINTIQQIGAVDGVTYITTNSTEPNQALPLVPWPWLPGMLADYHR